MVLKIPLDQKLLMKKSSIKLTNKSLNKKMIMRMSSLCMKNNTSYLGHTTTPYIYSDPEMQ